MRSMTTFRMNEIQPACAMTISISAPHLNPLPLAGEEANVKSNFQFPNVMNLITAPADLSSKDLPLREDVRLRAAFSARRCANRRAKRPSS